MRRHLAMNNFRSHILCQALAIAIAIGGGAITNVHAQEAADRKSFDVPSQPAASALNTFAEQADITLVFSRDSVIGTNLNTLDGNFTAEEALAELIEGTGLSYQRVDQDTFAVKNAGSSQTGNNQEISGEIASVEDSSVATLESIVVVGSRIGNVQPTSPVITLTRKDLDRSGAITASDALRLVPQNFSGVNSSTAYTTGSNIGATNKADIRGLGPQATLTLVNGRRISTAAGGDGDAVDLGLIPSAAIDRIEVLTDSASALYGSDAIGGVVNFVLRQDYDGAEISVRNDWNGAGADAKSASAMFGRSWTGGSFLAGLQYQSQDALRFDRIGISSTDFTAFGGGDFRTGLVGNPGNVLPLGFQYGLPFDTLLGPGGTPVFVAGIPAGQDGTALLVSDLGLNDANLGSLLPETLTPASRQVSIYANFRQSLGEVDFFADVVASDRRKQSRTVLLDLLYVPSSNAFSPFEEDVFVGYVFPDDAFGTYSTRARSAAVNAGIEGKMSREWDWKLFGIYSRDRSQTSISLPDSGALIQALASSDPTLAFNPFGDGVAQSQAVLEAVLTEQVSYGRTHLGSVNAEMRGSLFKLPGGDAKLALAAEHRKESLITGSFWPGLQSQDGINADRRVQAVAAEMFFPLVRQDETAGARELDLSIAGRWERYSDFGSTFNPKIGLRWKIANGLSFKTSWGTAFRAPSLRQLFGAEAVTPVIQVFDPNAPGGPATVFTELVQGGNPYLKEEHAETYSATLEFSPERVPGLNAMLTWYRIDYRDRIRGLLDGLDVTTFLTFESSLPAGLIRRDVSGNLERITLTDINSATTLVEGIDVSAAYGAEVGSGYMQLMGSAAAFTHYSDRLIDGVEAREASGRVGTPADWRSRIGLAWSSGEWSSAIFVNHVDGLKNEDADPRIVRRRVDAQTTVDLQLGYDFGNLDESMRDDWSIRLGIINAFDKRSPFVDGQQYFGVEAQNSRVDGRSLYLQVSKPFGQGATQR